jgi:hypothetical protein
LGLSIVSREKKSVKNSKKNPSGSTVLRCAQWVLWNEYIFTVPYIRHKYNFIFPKVTVYRKIFYLCPAKPMKDTKTYPKNEYLSGLAITMLIGGVLFFTTTTKKYFAATKTLSKFDKV